MRTTFAILLTWVFLALLPIAAMGSTCGDSDIALTVVVPNSGAHPSISLSPMPPSSARPLTFSVGMIAYIPEGAVASVDDHSIDVTLTARFYGFTTPPQVTCSSLTLDPLAGGSYEVNFRLIDTSTGDSTPQLIATGAFAVGGGAPVPASAPALGTLAKAFLMLVLLVLACASVSGRKLRN
jgi:hypothetical protein